MSAARPNHATRIVIPALTGLRGVAALWVVLFHYQVQSAFLGSSWFAGVLGIDAGWHGVDLFFVLSGFVLMLAHGEDFQTLTVPSTLAFLKLRVARVYPLNFVVLLLIVAAALFDSRFADWYRTLNPANYTAIPLLETSLLANRWGYTAVGDWNQPTWSLSIEIIGYLAFPLLAWGLIQRRSFWWLIGLAVVSFAFLAAIQIASHTTGSNRIGFKAGMLRMIFCFTAAMALAQAYRLRPDALHSWAPGLAVLSCSLIVLTSVLHRAEWIMAGCFALLVYSLAVNGATVGAVLTTRPAMFLGRISFPLYLLHVTPLLMLTFRFIGVAVPSWAGLALMASFLLGCFGISFLLHITIERPSHRWGRRWASVQATPVPPHRE